MHTHRSHSRTTARAAVIGATLALAIACTSGTINTTNPDDNRACALDAPTGLRTGSVNGITLWMIPPRLADACIAASPDSHVVFRAQTFVSPPRVFVFLAGTGGAPRNYQRILLAAAQSGYHAIGVDYPNDVSVSVRCAGQSVDCYELTRQEVLTGAPRSSMVAVDRVNSIEHRLSSLLRLMTLRDPAGHWNRFLHSDSLIAWDHISIGGHSQGGGFALFIAQRYVVQRASVYASYGDYLPLTGNAAPWVTRPYATPANRLFGFISTREDAISYATAIETWRMIGITGMLVNADQPLAADEAPPGQGFITSREPANRNLTATPFHDMVVLDVQTPLVAGSNTPVFNDVWRRISFALGTTPIAR